jgi:hypothetical protein
MVYSTRYENLSNQVVYYNADLIIISLKINLFILLYSWTIAELALNNNRPLARLACLLGVNV